MEEKNLIPENKEEISVDKKEPTTSSVPESKTKHMFLLGLAGFVGGVFVFLAVTGLIGVYINASTGKITEVVSTVLRLPLAKIDGKTIYYSEFLSDLKAINTIQEYEKSITGLNSELTNEEKNDQVLLRLINNIFYENLAKQFGVTLDKKEIKDFKEELLEQFESPQEANKELLERYGWTLSIYEKKVIKPYLLQSKVFNEIEQNISGLDLKILEARAKAEEILAEVKAGGDFAKLAEKYNEDGTAETGGDLDWFGEGEMIPQFEDVAFSLKKGEITEDIVETYFGYHIIKVTDKRVNEEGDEEVRASHIFVALPSIEEELSLEVDRLLDEEMAKAQVNWFVKKISNPLTK